MCPDPVPASNFGVLYVVPSTLGDSEPDNVLPKQTLATLRRLQHFVVEEAKTARAFLKRAGIERPLAELNMQTLNEHTDKRAIESLLEPVLQSND
ncbi:MAG: SAM-dependent methyltransferase, partial [Proteobacteria bacterium]